MYDGKSGQGLKMYDEAYTKCTKCTMECTLSVQSLRWKKYTKCKKFTMKRTLNVKVYDGKSVPVV